MSDSVFCKGCKKENTSMWMSKSCPHCGRHYTHKGFQGAFDKGVQAFEDGKTLADCPYEDKRCSYRECITFSRAFINMWYAGWRYAKETA